MRKKQAHSKNRCYMKKFIAAAILFASAVPAFASPFSDFAARVQEIRQAKNLPLMKVVEDTEALEYLNYLKNHEDGDAVSTGSLRVTGWAASATYYSSGVEFPVSAASRANAIYETEEQYGNWPKSLLFDRDSTVVKVAILRTKNSWLIATPRQKRGCQCCEFVKAQIFVCNYRPAGNIVGRKPF
jgi:hypothetical protein